MGKPRLKKLTILVPEDLLRAATKATGRGITPTVRTALQLVAAREAYEHLRSLRGKLRLGISWKELRKD